MMASPEYFSRRMRFVQGEYGCLLGAARWFGSKRSATVETEGSAVPRRAGGHKGFIPFLGLAR